MGNAHANQKSTSRSVSSTAVNSAATIDPLLAGVREIDYADISFPDILLGSGGAGAVRKGEWNCISVAVKTLHIPDATEFLTELRILSEVGRHPYIVELLGACTKPPYMAIVTQFMERGNLADLIENKNENFDWELIILMARDICKGMVHIHHMGLIHRDLKSSNLLVASLSNLESEVRIKICDFGISKKESMQMTKFVGTPLYMAPEMYIDPSHYSNAIDVYAFGIILWELITRKKPFHEVKSSFELERVVREGGRPSVPADSPPIIANLISRCWDSDAKKRPTFKESLEQLDQAWLMRGSFPKLARGSPFSGLGSKTMRNTSRATSESVLTSSPNAPGRTSPSSSSTSLSSTSGTLAHGHSSGNMSYNPLMFGPTSPTLGHGSFSDKQLPRTISPSNPHFNPATTINPQASPTFLSDSSSRSIPPPTLIANVMDSVALLESSGMAMLELRETLARCARIVEFSDRLPMDDYSEFTSHLAKLHDLISQMRKKPSIKKHIQQPLTHRQIEQLCSLLLRMTQTYQTVQLKNVPGIADKQSNFRGLFLDEDVWNMWNYYAGESVLQEWDTFVANVLQFGTTLSPDFGGFFNEGAQSKLKSILDPACSGSVSIFKFAALTNLVRPFHMCLQNMHELNCCEWFHGYISKDDVDLLLKGKTAGTFLFNFLDPNPCPLVINYVLPNGSIGSEVIEQYGRHLVSFTEVKRHYPQLTNPYSQDISWSCAFFGSISYEDAQELLTGQLAGAYLIRLSQSSPGSFVIAYVSSEGKVHQIKIDWQGSHFMMNSKPYVSLKVAIQSYTDTFKGPSYMSKHQPSIAGIAERLRRMVVDVPIENHYQDISKVLPENHYASLITH